MTLGGGTMMITENNQEERNSNGLFVYIVQRCWYSGPCTTPPVDYRRLLLTRHDADQVAYHSAHSFASDASEKVRTLQLPDGSYGFLAANHLFWVRQVSARSTVRPHETTQQQQQLLFQEAHCILSPDGTLLGGTNKRRNFLLAEPHSIFVGPQSSHVALQWLVQQEQANGRTIQWVPVGPPPTLQHLAVEWPGSYTAVVSEEDEEEPSVKRTADDDTVWFGHSTTSNEQQQRPSKRRMFRSISFDHNQVDTTTTKMAE